MEGQVVAYAAPQTRKAQQGVAGKDRTGCSLVPLLVAAVIAAVGGLAFALRNIHKAVPAAVEHDDFGPHTHLLPPRVQFRSSPIASKFHPRTGTSTFLAHENPVVVAQTVNEGATGADLAHEPHVVVARSGHLVVDQTVNEGPEAGRHAH